MTEIPSSSSSPLFNVTRHALQRVAPGMEQTLERLLDALSSRLGGRIDFDLAEIHLPRLVLDMLPRWPVHPPLREEQDRHLPQD